MITTQAQSMGSSLGIIFVAIALMVLAIYLLRYKGKNTDTSAYVNTLNIPEFAKTVRLNELNKKTAPKFTKAWFLEYWQGKRTAFYAWSTWFVIGAIALRAITAAFGFLLGYASVSFSPLKLSPQAITIFGSLFDLINLCYLMLASVMLWRCANNSSLFFKYFSRLFVVVVMSNVLMSVYHLGHL